MTLTIGQQAAIDVLAHPGRATAHESNRTDHTAGLIHCVNPAHLEPVTHEENVRRSNLP